MNSRVVVYVATVTHILPLLLPSPGDERGGKFTACLGFKLVVGVVENACGREADHEEGAEAGSWEAGGGAAVVVPTGTWLEPSAPLPPLVEIPSLDAAPQAHLGTARE
jgi:hypothetical protein